MADKATKFCGATFLHTGPTKDVWRDIHTLWTFLYVRPHEFLSVEKGSGRVSNDIERHVEAVGINLLEDLVENAGKPGIVETYHAPTVGFHENYERLA